MDHATLNWCGARKATYLIHQHFRYEYPGPIRDLDHRLMIVPRLRHGDQRRIVQRVDILPDARAVLGQDAFGNELALVALPHVEGTLEFEHWSVVERNTSHGEHRVTAGQLADPRYRNASKLTRPDAELREAAQTLRAAHADPLELANALNTFVHRTMSYKADVTDVSTTAAAAFALRRGVCQDYAHVMLAIARTCGLAARYVSGHLLGEAGTHAWVEVLIPSGDQALVVAFDPTHGCRTTLGYLVVAVGRDYADVAPTSGVYSAPYVGRLRARKRVGVSAVEYAA
ncbi:MAG TPA: transglutaminase family protein [Candidatus Acidoferrales bacterium]|nr:transglutaminase family protein [Candidatus Acidoferrales bacterium]